ncbi:MAG: hypothetical protein IT347_11910 [Candidatus Eisenbacteria bacterium]|nr:hypothetical protein [Candidatus Eisenbacteria bacterium]
MSAPRLLLGATSLELPAVATRDRALEVAARFREPESLAVTLVKALAAGADGVYGPPSATMRAALRELRRGVPMVVRLPLTPPDDDVHEAHSLDEQADGGATRAFTVARGGFAGLALLPAALTGHLAARAVARCERELKTFTARAPLGVAFAASVTDLALAAGNARAFERLVRWGRARFGGLAGFETRNLGTLLARLHEWGVEPDFVIGAVNPRGFAMRPDPASVLAALGRPGIPVLATELCAGGTVPLEEAARFALDHGAGGLVPELIELDDVAGELRGLAAHTKRAGG